MIAIWLSAIVIGQSAFVSSPSGEMPYIPYPAFAEMLSSFCFSLSLFSFSSLFIKKKAPRRQRKRLILLSE